MHRQILVSAVALSMMTGWAAAQTNPPASGGVAPNPATTKGMQTTQSTTVTAKFVTVNSADLLATRLIGTNVRNKQNESVGEIDDLVIENGKTVTALVIGVGGFLGMGERYVSVDPASVLLTRDGSGWRATLDTTKDNLKAAPTFNYSKRK